jgi:hypothetical protein
MVRFVAALGQLLPLPALAPVGRIGLPPIVQHPENKGMKKEVMQPCRG